MFRVWTLTNEANEITSQAVNANLICCLFCENSCRVMQGMHGCMCVCACLSVCVCVCVCMCAFPVSAENQPVNRHLWAAGHLAPAQLPHREERNCWPHTHTHIQTMYACTNKRYITTHRHTNIHKHTDPLNNTLSHKHISLGSHRRQTLPCLLPCRKLSQEGARD